MRTLGSRDNDLLLHQPFPHSWSHHRFDFLSDGGIISVKLPGKFCPYLHTSQRYHLFTRVFSNSTPSCLLEEAFCHIQVKMNPVAAGFLFDVPEQKYDHPSGGPYPLF